MKVKFRYPGGRELVREVELPDDIEGPEDLRQFVLDEAPFLRLVAHDWEEVTDDTSLDAAVAAEYETYYEGVEQ